MWKWLYTFYVKYKTALMCAAVVGVFRIFSQSEQYIIDEMISSDTSRYSNRPDVRFNKLGLNHSCPYKPWRSFDSPGSQYSRFYWSSTDMIQIYKIRKFAPCFVYIFVGFHAENYGGQKAILLSLIGSTFIMYFHYFTLFNSIYIFLIMVVIRRFTEGIIRIAWISIAVQWGSWDKISTFVAITAVGLDLGNFVGRLLTKTLVNWENVSFVTSCLGLVTILWWWLVCRCPKYQFSPINRPKHIPWRYIFFSKSLYIMIFLVLTAENYSFIVKSVYFYLVNVLFFRLNPESSDSHILNFFLLLTTVCSALFYGISSNILTDNKIIPSLATRKLFLSATLVVIIFTIPALTLAGCNQEVALGCLIILTYSNTITNCNTNVALIESAPLYPCILAAITFIPSHTFNLLSTLLLTEYRPLMRGADLVQWSKMFYIMVTYTTVTSLPYLLCGQTEAARNKDTRSAQLQQASNQTPVNNTLTSSSPLKDD